MKQYTKVKPQNIKKAHYVTSLTAFVLAFGILGVVLELSSFAATTTRSIVNGNGKCLDNYNGLTRQNNKIQLWACVGDNAQAWSIDGTATTAGTITNKNGYCLGTSSNGLHAVLQICNDTASQQWLYDASSGEIVNKNSTSCLEDTNASTTNGNQIGIANCSSTLAQVWHYTTVTPKPHTATSAVSGTKNPSISVTDNFAPPAAAPKLNQSGSTGNSDTAAGIKLNQTGTTGNNATATAPSPTQKPVIANVAIADITTSSARLSWESNVIADYIIKYGVSPKALTTTDSFSTTSTSISVVLHKLPANKHIYVTITPLNGTITGAENDVSFITDKSDSIWTPLVIILILVLIVIGLLIAFIGRKPVVPDHAPEEITPDNPPTIPEEDLTTYNNRVNWWMPQRFRQTGLPKSNKNEAFPDMYEEGRERLEEEEREHKLPKE